jgi:hypothetical protein
MGAGVVFFGREHSGYRVGYSISPDCPWHEPVTGIVDMPAWSSDTPLATIRDEAAQRLGGLDALDLSREIVARLECASCGTGADVFQPAERVRADQLTCPSCGRESAPVFLHSLASDSPLLSRTVRELGLPVWDVIWARRGPEAVAFALSGDREACLEQAAANQD